MLFKDINQNPFPGEGFQQGPRIPWYASQFSTNPSTAGIQPAQEICETWPDIGVGNKFSFAYLDVSGEAPATLAAGVVLMDAPVSTDTVAATLTDTSTSPSTYYGVTLTTGLLTPNAEVGNFIFFADLGLTFQIEGNTAADVVVSKKGTIFGNNQYDPNYLPAAPANGTAVTIFRPGHVVIGDDTHPPVGVLLNDTLEGAWIVMQVRGLAMVLGNDSGAALVAGIPAITTSAGIIQGGSASAAALGDAVIIPQVAYDGATLKVPVYFKAAGL